MVATNVQVQHQKQRNVTHTTVQFMEDGQLGVNLVAAQSPVELEVKNMSGLVQIQNPNMVETIVKDNQQNQKIVIHINVLFMVDGQNGLNQEVVPKNVELEAKNM